MTCPRSGHRVAVTHGEAMTDTDPMARGGAEDRRDGHSSVVARRGSTARRVAVVALATALIAAGTPSASLANPTSPTPSASASVIHGWVGARGGPAGLYSWVVGPLAWMHRVPADYPSSGTVEITFGTPSDTSVAGIPMNDLVQWSPDQASPDPRLPDPAIADPVLDVRLQAWLVDVDGTRVVITVKSFPDTAPGLVAEAEGIVQSVQVDPTGVGPGRRLVFQLPDGWDSG